MHLPTSPLSTFRAGLAGLSMAEQKAVFDCLPGAFQAALWQDRLRDGIETVRDKAQRAVLSDLHDALTPDSYADEKANKAANDHIAGLESRIEQVFPDHSVFEAYTQRLGDEACPEEVIPVVKGALPTCTCSSARSCLLRHNDCGALRECNLGGCNPTRLGCGVLWLQACDGLCSGQWC